MDDDDERHAQFLRRNSYRNTPSRSTSAQQSSLPEEAIASTHNWPAKKVWKDRIRHFTWTFFTMTMATGGIANVLHTGSDLRPSEPSERTDRADSSNTSALPF